MGLAQDVERTIAAGGVVVFPTDTVYGIGCDPANEAAIERMYALKGRPREKRSATMWFAVDALPPLTPRVAAAARALLPGPVTLVVGELGIRVPAVPLLAGVGVPVLQTSANLSGGPDPRRLEDVPPALREGADLVVDGGELPGTASTVVDLSEYEASATWAVLRDGALPRAVLEAVL